MAVKMTSNPSGMLVICSFTASLAESNVIGLQDSGACRTRVILFAFLSVSEGTKGLPLGLYEGPSTPKRLNKSYILY